MIKCNSSVLRGPRAAQPCRWAANVDYTALRTKIGVAGLLGGVWLFLLMAPPALAGLFAVPPASIWWIFGLLLAYFVYTGIRAWRRGWKSRFVLRIVVPLSLLVLSSVVTGAWLCFS